MKNLYFTTTLLLFVLHISGGLHAQTLFNNRYGSLYADEGKAICVTGDSGYAVAGVSQANGAGGDMFIMKLNQQGAIQWQKNIFGVNAEVVTNIVQLADGNYIIGGTTSSYGSGCSDALMVKLDSLGNLIWSKAFGDINCNQILGFSIGLNNSLIAAGTSDGGGGNGWLLNIDQNGAILWSKNYLLSNEFSAVKPTSDGGYLAVGSNTSISILKTNSSGTPQWYKRYLPALSNNACYDVIALEDGSVVLAGQVYLNAFGGVSDVFLMKINPSGNLIWFKTYGFTFFEQGFSVKKALDSGFIIAGYTNSFGNGDDDALLLKTNQNGDLVWAKTYGDIWYDRAEKVEITADSGYVFVGTSLSTSSMDSSYIYVVRTDKLGNSCDDLDWTPLQQVQTYPPTSQNITAFNFGVDSTCTVGVSGFAFAINNLCVTTSLGEIAVADFSIYPNPVSSMLKINGLPANTEIQLYSLAGELLLSTVFTPNEDIDLTGLQQGIYVLQSRYGIKKVVKI